MVRAKDPNQLKFVEGLFFLQIFHGKMVFILVFITIKVIESPFCFGEFFQIMVNHHHTSSTFWGYIYIYTHTLLILDDFFGKISDPSGFTSYLRMRVKGKLKGRKQPGEAGFFAPIKFRSLVF